MSKNTTYLEKIRNLLDLAESSNEHEANLAREQAERLMVRWSVDESMLEADKDSAEKGQVIQEVIPLKGVYAVAHATLASCIAAGLGNVKTLQVRRGNKTTGVVCVGYASDVDRLKFIFTSLQLQANIALDRWWKAERQAGTHDFLSANEKYLARRTFLMTFSGGVRDRMVEEREFAEDDTPGYALVLRDRSQEVEDRANEMYPNTKNARRLKGSGLGRHEGYAAGRNSNVGTTGVGA